MTFADAASRALVAARVAGSDGASIADSVATVRLRELTDQGAAITDAAVAVLAARRAAADDGAAVTDSAAVFLLQVFADELVAHATLLTTDDATTFTTD